MIMMMMIIVNQLHLRWCNIYSLWTSMNIIR